MKKNFSLKNIHALLIDIDGTLLSGKNALPGMPTFIQFLNQQDINYRILTNNSTLSPEAFYQKLRTLGAVIQRKNILTCASVTAQFMRENLQGEKVFVIGEQGIIKAVETAGYKILTDFSEKADIVVVGGDHFLTYEKLKFASLHLQAGAHFIGTNPDVLVPSEEGLIPECGVNLAALEAACGRKATVIGKPNPVIFQWALKELACSLLNTAMIGDRLETDIMGGLQAGIKTILVETGVDNRAAVIQKGIYPDLIVKDLPELVSQWQAVC